MFKSKEKELQLEVSDCRNALKDVLAKDLHVLEITVRKEASADTVFKDSVYTSMKIDEFFQLDKEKKFNVIIFTEFDMLCETIMKKAQLHLTDDGTFIGIRFSEKTENDELFELLKKDFFAISCMKYVFYATKIRPEFFSDVEQ